MVANNFWNFWMDRKYAFQCRNICVQIIIIWEMLCHYCCYCCTVQVLQVLFFGPVRMGKSAPARAPKNKNKEKTSSTCIEAMGLFFFYILKTHDHKPWKHNFNRIQYQFRNKNKTTNQIQEFQTHSTHFLNFIYVATFCYFHFWWCIVICL